MALFNKFFTSHKRKNVQNADTTTHQKPKPSIFPFSNDQVRIVLYRECDWSGRRLLFDSSAIQKVNLSTTTIEEDKTTNNNCKSQKNYIEVSNGYGYKYMRPETDYNSIGEMIFGSVAMSFRGTSLKVHWLQSPNRILCSQVFLSPASSNPQRRSSTNNTNSDLSSFDTGSLNSFTLSLSLCVSDNLNSFPADKQTNPLDVPESTASESIDGTRSYEFSGCDSGYCGTETWNTSCSSYCPRSTRSSIASIYSVDHTCSSRKLSMDSSIIADSAISGRSDGSLQRRILRNLSTSFENNLSGSDLIGFFGDSVQQNGSSSTNVMNRRRYSDQMESRSNPEMVRRQKGASKDSLRPPPPHFSSYTPKPKSAARRSKIGLAICITFSEAMEEEMQLFCSEHIALLESMLCRLRATAESAYINQKRFHQVMLHAWIATTTWVTDLFTAPRLSEPIWLTLSTGTSENPNRIAQQFMTELCSLLTFADTKDTNFFISTLLTAILTNHLGWVGTVAPLHNCTTSQSAATAANQMRAKMSEISKFHPYNALWAQLGDLYGAIGNPTKISKTIVCGSETMIVNKLLNVLTYFIRCGEIRRANDTEVIEQEAIAEILRNVNQSGYEKNVSNKNTKHKTSNGLKSKSKGLTRTATCLKDLTSEMQNIVGENDEDQLKMNDIPNVLAFRDSRFVRQELRIGNFLMDTGIEMNLQQKQKIQTYQIKGSESNAIRLLVTSPENDEFECETAAEAIDYVLKKKTGEPDEIKSLSQLITANSLGGNKRNPVKLLWGIEPVKEGIIEEQWQHMEKNVQMTANGSNELGEIVPEIKTENSIQNGTELKRSKSLFAKSASLLRKRRARKTSQESSSFCYDIDAIDIDPAIKSFSSLSDLITANSVGVSDRLVWGIEPVKEGVCLEEEQHFEIAQKRIEMEHDLKPKSSVVFVLGDNEVLSGLRNGPSSQNLLSGEKHLSSECENSEQTLTSAQSLCSTQKVLSTPSSSVAMNTSNIDNKKKCTHKKHSGVKFNFEQYPQIVTNYMKNKNLDLANYDFLEKGLKLEDNFGASSSVLPPMLLNDTKIVEEEEEEICECCANSSRILQTPSNATELEFSSDDNSYPTSPTTTTVSGGSASRKQSIDVGQRNHNSEDLDTVNVRESFEEEKTRELNVINLPIPKSRISKKSTVGELRPGFAPSLFGGITDHYISDMVLQGTSAPLPTWEPSLKQNLALASHCATLEQTPTENIAIIANVDQWDVKLVSSQTYVLPRGSGTSGPIGMSQLVASMLETVHAMWTAGTSAYQCMSFMESKLQEMYLRSETLAAFLLATEFCSLNSVTSALNLSDNDVPLLLSVASIHSPQVTKKYGVSFR